MFRVVQIKAQIKLPCQTSVFTQIELAAQNGPITQNEL